MGRNFTGIPEKSLALLPISFGESLYAVWYEHNGTAYQIRVAAYNGTSWNFVDGNGTNGINYNPSKHSDYPYPIVWNGQLFISWSETSSTTNRHQISVILYDVGWSKGRNPGLPLHPGIKSDRFFLACEGFSPPKLDFGNPGYLILLPQPTGGSHTLNRQICLSLPSDLSLALRPVYSSLEAPLRVSSSTLGFDYKFPPRVLHFVPLVPTKSTGSQG